MSTLLVDESVLRDIHGKVVPEGRLLLLSLSEHYKIAIGTHDGEVEKFKTWCLLENVRGHQEVVPGNLPAALRGVDPLIAQLDSLRGRGEHVSLVLDTSPQRIEDVFKRGVSGLLFVCPRYSSPEFRPDFEASVRPWDDLVAEIERQHYLAVVGEPEVGPLYDE